jgi:hypothetical protein
VGIEARIYDTYSAADNVIFILYENAAPRQTVGDNTNYEQILGDMVERIQDACLKNHIIVDIFINSITRERPEHPWGLEYVKMTGSAVAYFAVYSEISIFYDPRENAVVISAEWPTDFFTSPDSALTFTEEAQNLFSLLNPRSVRYNMPRAILDIRPHGLVFGSKGISSGFAASIRTIEDRPPVVAGIVINYTKEGDICISKEDMPEKLWLSTHFHTDISVSPAKEDPRYGSWHFYSTYVTDISNIQGHPHLDDVVAAVRRKDASSMQLKIFLKELLMKRVETIGNILRIPADIVQSIDNELLIDVDEEWPQVSDTQMGANFTFAKRTDEPLARGGVKRITLSNSGGGQLSKLKAILAATEYINNERPTIGDTVTFSDEGISIIRRLMDNGLCLIEFSTKKDIALSLLRGVGETTRNILLLKTPPSELSVRIDAYQKYAPTQEQIDSVCPPAEVVLFVDEPTYANLKSEIDEYVQNISGEGHNAKIHVVSPSWGHLPPENLRNTIIAYNSCARQWGARLEGVVLIGFAPLPYMSEEADTSYFSSNAYYMALDDLFYDRDGDQFLETRGKYDVDIWVARMFPTDYLNAENILRRYLGKINAYHRGEIRVPDIMLAAAIGGFAPSADDMQQILENAWPSMAVVKLKDITRGEYISKLNEHGAKIVWLDTHGSSYSEEFGGGFFTKEDAEGISKGALLYVLRSCSNSDLLSVARTDGGYIAGSYIYGSGNGLASIAYSRVGGMPYSGTLFLSLAKGSILGDAYLNLIREGFADLLMLNGDPFLRI